MRAEPAYEKKSKIKKKSEGMRVQRKQKGTGVCPLGTHKDIGQGEKVKLQMKIVSPLGFGLASTQTSGLRTNR